MNKLLLSVLMLTASSGLTLNAQTIIDENFESGKGEWSARGGESVSIAKDVANSGGQSLKVSSRSDYWNGATCASEGIQAGQTYDVEAYVYFDGTTFTPATTLTGDMIPLKDAYNEENYFKLGTCLGGQNANNSTMRNMIKTHFNSVTPENELKPDATLNQNASKQNGNNVNPQAQLNSGAQAILKFCEDNGIALRGHCFIWHSQTPTWLFKERFNDNGNNVSVEIMDQRMENYIKNVIQLVTTSYPKLKIYAWDVVNEAFNEDGTLRSAGNNSISPGQSYWYQIYKSNDYIKKAFTFAKKYAPKGCKLYYNDYNEYDTQKRDGIYKLVKEMYEAGICDGVGMQSHLDLSHPNASLYEEAIQKYASIGCDIQITELDVTSNNDNQQASYYEWLFNLYKKYKDNISAVVLWGVNDGNSWRGDRKPLLFDNSYNPKPCYYSVIKGMSASSSTEESEEDNTIKEKSFELCFQYSDGETKYPTIKSETIPSKTWTKISGVMEVPADATNVSVYVQSTDTGSESDLIDFYIDDVKCAVHSDDPTSVSNALAENDYALSQNMPNPASDQTSIYFSLKENGLVSIALYNSLGVKVMDVINNNFPAGSYKTEIDVNSLASGIYFYEMNVNGFSARKAMIVK